MTSASQGYNREARTHHAEGLRGSGICRVSRIKEWGTWAPSRSPSQRSEDRPAVLVSGNSVSLILTTAAEYGNAFTETTPDQRQLDLPPPPSSSTASTWPRESSGAKRAGRPPENKPPEAPAASTRGSGPPTTSEGRKGVNNQEKRSTIRARTAATGTRPRHHRPLQGRLRLRTRLPRNQKRPLRQCRQPHRHRRRELKRVD